jgi:DNA-binding response OmpR family regulator
MFDFRTSLTAGRTSGPSVILHFFSYQWLDVWPIWWPACPSRYMPEKVLIVDDDEQLVDAYRDYLSSAGYDVDCAQELEEAQTLLTYFTYSVVITDLRLSKLEFGGLELIKHIREHCSNTRVVVVTAYGWPELKTEASDSGADAFLRKPTRLKELGAAVSVLMGAEA